METSKSMPDQEMIASFEQQPFFVQPSDAAEFFLREADEVMHPPMHVMRGKRTAKMMRAKDIVGISCEHKGSEGARGGLSKVRCVGRERPDRRARAARLCR